MIEENAANTVPINTHQGALLHTPDVPDVGVAPAELVALVLEEFRRASLTISHSAQWL